MARIARVQAGRVEQEYKRRNVKTSRRSANIFAACHCRLDVGTLSNDVVTRLGSCCGEVRHLSMSRDDLRRVEGFHFI